MKNKASLVSNTILFVFNMVFLAWFAWLFYGTCFLNSSDNKYKTATQLFYGGAVLLALLALTFFIKHMSRNEKVRFLFLENQEKKMLFFGIGILFVIQLIIIGCANTSILWDPGQIVTAATSKDFIPVWTDYLSYYPNNVLLAFVIRVIFKIGRFFGNQTGSGIWVVLDVMNAIGIDIGIFLSFHCAKKLFGRRVAYITFLFMVLLIGISPWILVPYSDTLAIPFTVGILWLCLKMQEQKKVKTRMIYSVGIGLFSLIAYHIKPSTIIVLMGIGIVYMIKKIGQIQKIKKGLLYGVIIAVVMLLGQIMWNGYIYQVQSATPLKKELAFPGTYWVMTGLSAPYGVCNADDQWFTIDQGTTEKMKEAQLIEIKNRLNTYGVSGYLAFADQKMHWVISEGNFYWGTEGGYHCADYNFKNTNLIKEFYYYGGAYFEQYLYISQGIWLVILLFIVSPMFMIIYARKKMTGSGITLIRFALTGILLFILLTEGRSRYLICSLPYFAMAAAYGYDSFLRKGRQLFLKNSS